MDAPLKPLCAGLVAEQERIAGLLLNMHAEARLQTLPANHLLPAVVRAPTDHPSGR